MGSKRINQYKLLNLVALSGTDTVTSATQNFNNLDNVFIQIRFVGTMTGTLTVQASADGLEWDDLTFSPSLAQPAGSATSYSINIKQLAAGYFRLRYVNASGTGTLTATFFGKDLN